ncbi:hypothetical protein HPP92_020621 [Vanilla planifolia]|uniref:Mechanosensitive ion channel protein n=1 Tax=Vanilla planifolia TaxID=51239 RepID=A0A835UIM8_VANPL|nr:hypothetical protein HPP92_020621 [Vanilla planifolia]
MNSLRKSFKSLSSSKFASWSQFDDKEEQRRLILVRDPDEGSGDRREVIVKIDSEGRGTLMQSSSGVNVGSVWRESSCDFWEEGHLDGGDKGRESGFTFQSPTKREMLERSDDRPSQSMSSFVQKQRTAGVDMELDSDREMDEVKNKNTSLTSGKESNVLFHDVSTDNASGTSIAESSCSASDEKRDLPCTSANPSTHLVDGTAMEIGQCSPSSSFRPSCTLVRAKTKSRLMDHQPTANIREFDERRSTRTPTRSGILKSGVLGKTGPLDEEEEDPFADLPKEFNRTKISTITIVELIGLFIVVATLACSLTIRTLSRRTIWGLHLWKWEALLLVLISGRLLSGWAIRIVVFFLERNFLLRKRFLYFVYGVRKAVQNCIWLGLVLLAWHFLFDKKVVSETKALSYVTKILFCLIVATVLRLIKTLLLKVLASSFHVSTYFDRIQEALFNQYVIETLSGPPLLEIHNVEEEDLMMAEVQKLLNAGARIPNDLRATVMLPRNGNAGNSGIVQGGIGLRESNQIRNSTRLSGAVSGKESSRHFLQHGRGITIDQLHKLNQKNVSAWNMKRLMRMVRQGTLRTLDEQITHGKEEDESAMQISSEQEAKIAARKIFSNVAKPGAKYITVMDLMRFMKDEEAVKTMSLFCRTQDENTVSRRALKNWVVDAFRERRALSLTLNDTKTAVNKLHQIANVIVVVIVIAIWLLILNITTTHFFVFLSSQILLLAFVFGNTFKTTFEAMIFLFIMHPFDVGDRCEVNGVQMIVEEMNILTTIFLRYDNQKITYPNSVLATLPIGNFYRSPDMGDSIDFCIHVSTPMEKLAVMRERIIAFMESKKDHWHSGAQVVLRDVDDMSRLKVSIFMRHRINFQDMGMKFVRRDLVIQELIRLLRELDIEYRMLPMDVNIRNLPPVTSNRLPSTWTTCK